MERVEAHVKSGSGGLSAPGSGQSDTRGFLHSHGHAGLQSQVGAEAAGTALRFNHRLCRETDNLLCHCKQTRLQETF